MPLTEFQKELTKLLAQNRSEESFLAGGTAIHFEANSLRFSQDLDYFHDSTEILVRVFEKDRKLLEKEGYTLSIELEQSGFVRVGCSKGKDVTKIEWSHDSSWRFMPIQKMKLVATSFIPSI